MAAESFGLMRPARTESQWLEESARIGSTLCATAIRHQGRCTWLGRSVNELTDNTGIVQPTVAALGPDLYDGTAGVALFLAQLYFHTREAIAKTIALEAITHALDESKRSASQIGLYSGWGGIAFATARISILLDTPTLATRARALLAPLEDASAVEGASCDLIGGLAGSIMGLLSWPRDLRSVRDIETCDRLGSALAEAAIPWEDTWAWSSARAMGDGPTLSSQPLAGLSHGAAGMGVVLIDLGARTNNETFLKVGHGAFAYEAQVFEEREANWPDFRISHWNPTGRSFASLAWCHGGPGIALARLHALSIETHAEWKRDWEIGLATARREARDSFEKADDATLCHGIAGLVEPLVEASRLNTLSSRGRKIRKELERIWSALCTRFGAANTWPSGLPSHGPNPSLMLGTAGIGWTMLRMHCPNTPSVLLPLLRAER